MVGGAIPVDIALIALEHLQGLDLPDLAARGEDMVKVGHRVSRRPRAHIVRIRARDQVPIAAQLSDISAVVGIVEITGQNLNLGGEILNVVERDGSPEGSGTTSLALIGWRDKMARPY